MGNGIIILQPDSFGVKFSRFPKVILGHIFASNRNAIEYATQYPRNLSVKTQFKRTKIILLIVMIDLQFLICFKEDSFSCDLAFLSFSQYK